MKQKAPLAARHGPISVRAARVLYNVADALSGGDDGAVDVLPGVEDRIRWRGVGAARRTWLLLMAIEWAPILRPRVRRPFSRLPRATRRNLLAGWERSRLAVCRHSFAELCEWIAQAASPPDQSSGA